MARILLADQNRESRAQVRDAVLRVSRHEVIEALDGPNALSLLASARPDLAVLRVDLAEIDGFEVCRRIRSDERTHRVPVLLMADQEPQADRRFRALEAGAHDILVHPLSELELMAQIGTALRLQTPADEMLHRTRQLEALAAELRTERDMLRETFDVIGDALILLQPSGGVELANPAGQRLLAVVPNDIDGTDGNNTPPPMISMLRDLGREVINGRVPLERSLTCAGRQYQVHAYPAPGQRQLLYVRDITDERDREVRRLQSEKLASIGMMAAGVAHEINNPAAFVLANNDALGALLQTLHDRLAADPAVAERLGTKTLLFEAMAVIQESKEGMARIHRIVRDLNAFARVDESGTGLTNVNASVESCLNMLRSELHYRTEVKRDLRATRGVPAQPARLAQVFLNLLTNAAHALREDGLRRNLLVVRSYDDADHVVVEVEDNGPGISADLRSRVFESFFTTKPAGMGTGLGLPISRRIAESLGGSLTLEPLAEAGALFRVTLPAAAVAVVAASETRAPQTAPRRRRILAIDDEALLLKGYRRLLGTHHDLVLSVGGRAALDLLERDHAFEIVLCDLQMPDVSGAVLHATVTRRWPALAPRFVFVTGGAFSDEARHFLEQTSAPILNKPFELAEILDLIERHLNKLEGEG